MAADPMSAVCVIEVQLLDVLSGLPKVNSRVVTKWTDPRTEVVCHCCRQVTIGCLPAFYDGITSKVCCEGVVTEVRRGEDPVVMVRLTVPK